MKNTFGGLVKTQKLWESGWAIRERKKKTKQQQTKRTSGKSRWKNHCDYKLKKKKKRKQPNKKRGKKKKKKKLGKKVEGEDWKPDLGRI